MNRRNPLVAFLLSVFTPGLGHFYAGDSRKALLFFCLNCLYPLLCLFNFHFNFAGMVMLLAAGLTVQVYTAVDAARTAACNRLLEWNSYNRWYIHLLFAVIILVVRLLYPAEEIIGTMSFRVSSISMYPTLRPGDFIVTQTRAIDNVTLGYGDVAAFLKEEEVWLFRVVGLPGDHIRLDNDFLIINGRQSIHRQLSGIAVPAMPDDPMSILQERFEEVLPNGKRINFTRVLSTGTDSSTISTRTIPQGAYFLMGDNRDKALDSRYLGMIGRDRIVAKGLFILYSNDWKRIGMKL